MLFKTLCFLGLFIHLYKTQILKGDYYEKLSQKNRTAHIPFQAPRGSIVDAKGEILASNRTTYRVFIHPIDKFQEVVPKLSNVLQIDEPIKTAFGILIKDHLSWEELSKLQIFDIPNISIHSSQTRYYHHPELLSHILGYTGRFTPKDLKQKKELAQVPDQRIGKLGLEMQYEDLLQGTPGAKFYEINANHKILKMTHEKSAKTGNTLQISIHMELQNFIKDALKDYPSACCVIMNHTNGKILGYISKPGYDTNLFNTSIPKSFYKNLLQNTEKPLINRPIQALYPPASTLKMVVALAALEQGIVDPEKKVFCSGQIHIPGRKAYCWRWKYGGHGAVNMRDAIKKSCDVYFYYLALKLNPKILATVCHDFGLGKPTGIDLPGEKTGLVPTAEWKKKRFHQPWTLGDTLNSSIGQGFFLSTPLQMLVMIAKFARKGKNITPYFVEQKPHSKQDATYKEQDLEIILDGMNAVLNEEGGTGYNSRSNKLVISGKTGSAQVVAITKAQRAAQKVNDLPYHLREHAYFVGFAKDYSIVVVVEHGQWGSSTIPIARSVLEKADELFSENKKQAS